MKKTTLLRTLIAGLVVAGGLAVSAQPAQAAALTNVAWSISKPHPGDTGVRYTWAFTTGSAGLIRSVQFDVPAGTVGTGLNVPDIYGLTPGGTPSIAGTTVTYTMGADLNVASGVNILISMDGFTNTSTPGTYASTVTTRTSAPAQIDTAGSNNVTVSNNATAVTIKVARSTAFTLSTNAFTMVMDPSVPALTDRSVPLTMTVATNAQNGYSLSSVIDHQLLGVGGSSIGAASAGKATGFSGGAFPVNTFGYNVGVTGVGSASGAGFGGTGYVGYTTSGESVAAASTPTNGDTITVTNRARIDYLQRADTYTGIVTYTATPNY